MTLPAALRELLPPEQHQEVERLGATIPDDALLRMLVGRNLLTPYQADELRAGRGAGLVVGAHVLLARLGKGGMGEVFRARHTVMQREVALKRILPERLDSPGAAERFLREVRAAAKLSHPNVVQVHDAGEANGVHYLTMELLRGVTLAEYLGRKGPLPVGEAVEYVRQACLGMQHAHEQGLVHRDIKPANLWLTQQRQVKILDMGLALLADAGTLTQAGGYFGTADYMSPEQVEDSHKVDIRADVYSLGCTLYHLLTGFTPFHEAHPTARPSMHLSKEPTGVEHRRADLPAPVAGVVRKMMAKRREDRYQTPGEAADALAALPLLPSGETTQAGQSRGPPPSPPQVTSLLPNEVPSRLAADSPSTEPPLPTRAQRPAKRGVVLLLAVLLGGALALGLGCVGILAVLPRQGGKRETDKEKPAEAKLGGTFTNGVGMKFVRIPAGTFVMGSPNGEKERSEDERQHEVEITRDFWLGLTEVTQGQYREVMGYNPSYFSHDGTKGPTGTYSSFPSGGRDRLQAFPQKQVDEFPVENVSWQDTQEFCKKLNERPGEQPFRVRYRLPTEAEWEYACRGGSRVYQPFHFGDFAPKQGNIFPSDLRRTERVGSYAPNAFGLYDLHGNVWEWCNDWYERDYYERSPRRDPQGPVDGKSHVFRGGGWDDSSRHCRSANRRSDGSGERQFYYGFRVAAVPRE